MDYAQLAEKYAERAQAVDVSNETGSVVNALTAIAYGLLNLAEVTARLEQ